MVTCDDIVPKGPWQFDDDVTKAFDDMLQRSIPLYGNMRRAVVDLACAFRQRDTDIVDLGCSRGEALAPLVDKWGVGNRFIGCDVSEPMLSSARERFSGYIACGVVDIRNCDLRREYPPARASVTLAILTLQFVPIEYRQAVVRAAFQHTIPGGCLILVEKVLGATADLDALMVERYLDMKARNGYTKEQIDRKRLALEGVLVPVTARWNEDLLRSAGFNEVDCFWRWMNFAGWVAVRDA